VPAAELRIADDTDASVDAVCEALGLDILVLAERREARIGLQARRCSEGWGPRWVGASPALTDGVALVLAGPFDAEQLALAESWPTRSVAPPPVTPPIDKPRPWYRDGRVWGASAGVLAAVVGGVVTGVLLAGRERPPPTVDVDSDAFIGGF
jgi:hypothetical protein